MALPINAAFYHTKVVAKIQVKLNILVKIY